MSDSQTIQQAKTRMQQSLEHLKQELKGIRAGRANPALLEGISCEVYGAQMKMKELATIGSPEPRQLVLTPFDPQNAGLIAKAIDKANLGVRAVLEGKIVRVMFPELNEERRKELIGQCHKKREECKVQIRNIRRDINELLKKLKAHGDLPEDDMKRDEKYTQELTDKSCKEADDLSSSKEKEIMTI
jgi:ribosome recycling factor